ncbi:MAG: HEAT repeat domain-containing protein [Polyangia bacterium]|jgi:HEAT repeat protein|nr:HEAT repeat domain-containing protein [Polyangia bacterium]
MRKDRFIVGSFLCGAMVAMGAMTACPPKSEGPDGPARQTTGAGPGASTRPVWERLDDQDPQVRLAAVREIEADRSERALTALAARLGDGQAEVRKAAEEALARHGATAAPALVQALSSTSPGVPDQAARLIGRIGPSALEALRPAAAHRQPDVRRRAVELIGQWKEPAAAELLLGALGDSSDAVRAAAIPGLRAHRAGPALDRMLEALRLSWFGRLHSLIAVLGDLQDPRVAATAIEKFGSTTNTFSLHELLSMLVAADPAWMDRVAEALGHANELVRSGVLRALRYDAKSLHRLQSLASLMEDEPLETWAKAERSRIGAALRSEKAKQALAQLQKSVDTETRHAVAELLVAADEKADLGRAERDHLKSLERAIAAISRGKPRPAAKGAPPAPAEGPDQLVILYAQLGELRWGQSCPVPQVHGLCVATTRTTIGKDKGASVTKAASSFVARRPAMVKQAKAAYEQAVKTWQDGAVVEKIPASAPDRVRRIARARHYAAWAQFQLGEIQLDELLRPSAMPGVRVEKPKGAAPTAQTKQLEAWLDAKRKQLDQAVQSYGQALDKVKATIGGKERRSDFWSVAAVARKGQLFELFSRLVSSIPMPKGLPEGEAQKHVEAFKTAQALPFRQSAAKEYLGCLGETDKLLRFWEWGLVCESGLGRVAPDRLGAWRQTNPFRGIRAPRPAPKQ